MCACLAYRHPLPKWSCRDKASLPTHASPYRYDARCSPAGVWRAAGTRDVVDLVDPSDALAREHAQDMIGIEHAVAEGHAKATDLRVMAYCASILPDATMCLTSAMSASLSRSSASR